MNIYETLSIIISIIALVISIIAFFRTNSIAMGQLELLLNERLTSTKNKVADLGIEVVKAMSNNDLSDDLKDTYKASLNSAIENNLNVYEEACAKYLDKKIDRKRFKKAYISEIRELVQNKNYTKYFNGVTSKYKAILKVYKEWEDLEK